MNTFVTKNLISLLVLTGLLTVGFFVEAQTTIPSRQPSRFQVVAINQAKSYMDQVQEQRNQVAAAIKVTRQDQFALINTIKDLTKRQTAKDIIEEVDYVNLAWTNYYIDSLAQLDAIAAKIKSRSEKARLAGHSVVLVDQAISQADQAITTARRSLLIQVAKTYPIDTTKIKPARITSDLRTQFQQNRDALLVDFMSFRDGPMKNARITVDSAFKILSQTPGI